MPETGFARGISVPYTERGSRDGSSPVESLDLESSTATRIILVDWDQRFQAYREALGYSQIDDAGVLTRYLPDQHPEAPWLFANKVSRTQGKGWTGKTDTDGGSTNVFGKCELAVEYGCRPYEVLQDDEIDSEFERFVEVETTIEGDYLSLPNAQGVAKWAEGSNAGTSFPGQIGKIVCFENYVFRWHQIPDLGLPEAAILRTVGTTNMTDFGLDPLDNARLYFPAGKLLMLGGGWRRIFSPYMGEPQWTVEYMVKFNPKGHSKFYDFKASVPDWYQVTMTGVPFDEGSIPDGMCVYDEAEYADLFNTVPLP